MTLNLHYNNSTRVYNWTNPLSGEIMSFPAKAKGEATKFIISLLHPKLYQAATRLIEKQPQLERVTWKAVEIVANQGVELKGDGLGSNGRLAAMVESSDGMGRYAIEIDNGFYTCQCEHWISFTAPVAASGNRYCKHIIASYLARITA